MNYIPLDSYPKVWVFLHQDLPVSAQDLAHIKPMTAARAGEVWRQYVSEEALEADEFGPDDWAAQEQSWQAEGDWQAQWDSDDSALPPLLAENLKWEDNTVVYFCYAADHIIETTWDVFRRTWKNFLFMGDGCLLLGRKRREAVQFFENGTVRLGERP